MAAFKTVFKDAVADNVPMKGSKGTYGTEDGFAGSSGLSVPQKIREDMGGKTVSFKDLPTNMKWLGGK
jgi:hypothetical protein